MNPRKFWKEQGQSVLDSQIDISNHREAWFGISETILMLNTVQYLHYSAVFHAKTEHGKEEEGCGGVYNMAHVFE